MIEVSNVELDLAYEGPAFAANKFFVSVMGPMVRIAFCEGQGSKIGPKFRTAVSMHAQDALALAEVLKELLTPQEKEEVQ